MTTKHEISARNRLFNVDGFGVAYYTPVATAFNSPTTASEPHLMGLRPALYKNHQPPLHDTNFRSLCANTSSTAIFAHIRAATATPVTSVNNHPFVFGRHAIMHNGSISNFVGICRNLADLLDDATYANIKGSTDSEHFAALYMTFLTNGRGETSWEEQYPVEEMRAAMRKATQTVTQIQRDKFGDLREANSLNVCATDGKRLVAVRIRNHATEQPPSLYWSTEAGATLNRKYPDSPMGGKNPLACKDSCEHGTHIIVASEPSTYDEKQWHVIEKNCCLMVNRNGEVIHEPLQYSKEWDAPAASTVGDGGKEE